MKFSTGLLAGLFLRGCLPAIAGLAIAGAIAVALFPKDGALYTALDNLVGRDTRTEARVIRAIDGDTLLVSTAGRQERVRVLGIDTPETVKPGTPVQRCGPEASTLAKTWVRDHSRVRLITDTQAPNRDRYERLLRYVEPRSRGRDLSTVQVAAGLARVKAYGEDLHRLDNLQAAQRRAKRARRGLWGTSCS